MISTQRGGKWRMEIRSSNFRFMRHGLQPIELFFGDNNKYVKIPKFVIECKLNSTSLNELSLY
jgi:hypothetical protein